MKNAWQLLLVALAAGSWITISTASAQIYVVDSDNAVISECDASSGIWPGEWAR